MRVLLIDDDHELAALLTEYLESREIELVHAPDGASGQAVLRTGSFDAVLLDVMLPGVDGFEVCRAIRKESHVPIMMLTARGDDADRIHGLELGADDYLPKPFNPRELVLRLLAIWRRGKPASNGSIAVGSEAAADRTFGDLTISMAHLRATLSGEILPLTEFEFRLLASLTEHAGTPVSREALARAVKGGEYDPSVDRSLDVHISHLRQKLGDESRERIRTVRGVGYMLVVAPHT